MASVKDRAAIHRQLAQAKETLTRLRAANGTQNGTSVDLVPPETTHGQAAGLDSARDLSVDGSREGRDGYGLSPPASRPADRARDSLVRVLGLQVTKMEDDLKVALLAHFEQVESQKEDMIHSFDVMHQQLLRHQDAWEEKRREGEKKDALIRRLQTSNEALKNKKHTSSPFVDEGHRALQALSPRGERFGIHDPHDELYENLLKENKYLRERLKEQQAKEQARQRQLYESYDKDVSKDVAIKRLQVENHSMREDMEDLQNELLRRNAGRLSAEKDVARVNQEMQFCEEQIRSLRDKLQQAAEEKQYLEETVKEAKDQADLCDGNLSLLEDEIIGLREKCESYRDKVQDKEDFAGSLKKENQRLGKIIDALKKELASARNETQTLRKEGERLHEEVAEREIDRLSSETKTEASSSKIKSLNEQLHEAENKAIELSEACRANEEREARLNQETLAAIEKYRRAEEELFMAKKELAHVKGFHDGAEKRRKQIQDEIENLRKENVSLQEKLKSNRKMEDESDEREENAKLKEQSEELQEEIKGLHSDVNKLEEALESARDKNSIQRMRLEGMETMMNRKDERIKALQNELVERHNQTDSLADALLRKNRETENLKLSMMMLEQELEALRTGGNAVRRALKDSSGFYTGEPATPDSGFADLDREKAIEKLSKEMFSNHTDKSARQVRAESGFHTIDEAQNEGESEVSFGEHDEGRTLSESTAENDDIKTMEAELRNIIDELERKLSEAVKQNEGLKLREQELEEALEIAQKKAHDESDAAGEQVVQDEQVLPAEYLINLCTVPEEPYNAVDPTQADNRLETVMEETWIELENATDSVDGRQGTQYLEEENKRLQKEIGQLEATVEDCESTLHDLTEEKRVLSEELNETRAHLQSVEASVVELQRQKDELQVAMEGEITAKDEDVEKLQKKLKDSDEMHENFKKALEDAEELCSEKERELLSAQGKNLALDKERQEQREQVENMQNFLEQAEQFTVTLQAELGEATEKIRRSDGEIAKLRQSIELAQHDSEKTFREKEGLEEKFQENIRVQRETEENLTALFNENQELHEQLQVAEDNIRELQEARQHENEVSQAVSENARKFHEQKIDELQAELTHSREKMEELKLTWKNSHDEKSDLKNELLEAKERIYEAATANDILVRRGNELERCLFEKEEQAERLRAEKDEVRRKLEEREKKMEEIDKELEHLREQIREQSEENDSLKEELREMQTDTTEFQKLASILEDEKKVVDEELQEAHESINDLERALEHSEDERLETERNLQEAQKEMDDLREAATMAEKRVLEMERENESSKDKLHRLQSKLIEEENKVAESRSQLEMASEKLVVLEQVKDESQGKEHLLHERLLNALNKVNEKEAECNDARERQHALETDVLQLQMKREELEREKKTVQVIREETQEELMSVQGDFTALQENFRAAETESEGLRGELERAQEKLTTAEKALQQSVEGNDALKADIKDVLAKVSELEVARNAKQSRVEELEDLLNLTVSKERSLEERLQDSTRKKDELSGRLEELSYKLRVSNDDCSSLERKLKRQKEMMDEVKQDLANKQEKLFSLTHARDSAESSLHSARTDLTRKEGKIKVQKEHLEQTQLELDQANRKTKELDAANRKVCRENEHLLREIHGMRDRVSRLETSNAQKEALVSRLESSLLGETNATTKRGASDDRLRNLGDKLSIAQIKLADLEHEIAKDIRKHELRSMRGRPLSALSGSSDEKDSKRKLYPSKENSFDSQKTEELLTQSDAESVESNGKRSSKAGSSGDRNSSARPVDKLASADTRGVPRVEEFGQENAPKSPELSENKTSFPNTAEADGEVLKVSALSGKVYNQSKHDFAEPLSYSGYTQQSGMATEDAGEAAIPTWQVRPAEEANIYAVEDFVRHDRRIPGNMGEGGVGEEALVALENQEEYQSAPGELSSRGLDGAGSEQPDPQPEQGGTTRLVTKTTGIDNETELFSLGLPPGELLRSDSSMTIVTELTTHRSSEFDMHEETPLTTVTSPLQTRSFRARTVDVTCDVTTDVTGDVMDPFMELMRNSSLVPPGDYADDDVTDPFAELMTCSSVPPPSSFVSSETNDPFDKFEDPVKDVGIEEADRRDSRDSEGVELAESFLRQPLVPKKEACKISNVVYENEYESFKKPSEIRKQLDGVSGRGEQTEKPAPRGRTVSRQKPDVPRRTGKLDQNSEASGPPQPKPRLKKAQKQKLDGAAQAEQTNPTKTDGENSDQTERESVFDLIAAFEGRKV